MGDNNIIVENKSKMEMAKDIGLSLTVLLGAIALSGVIGWGLGKGASAIVHRMGWLDNE